MDQTAEKPTTFKKYVIALAVTVLVDGLAGFGLIFANSSTNDGALRSGFFDLATLFPVLTWLYYLRMKKSRFPKSEIDQEFPMSDKLEAEADLLANSEASAPDPEVEKRQRRILVGVLFGITILCGFFTGVKAVIFDFGTAPGFPKFLMTVTVLVLSVELFLVKKLVSKLGETESKHLPRLHLHPIIKSFKIAGHWCDVCKQRIKIGSYGYTCTPCNWDLCLQCLKKGEQGEGLMRTDSGIIPEPEITTGQYMKRTFSFLKPFWKEVSVGVVCMLISASSSVLLPNYQGTILDDVINGSLTGDRTAFKHDITMYLIISVTIGIFGGLRNLVFELTARKLQNSLRIEAFRSLMAQDVAFFDGMNSGDLITRVNSNVSAMISPMTYMMTSVVTNLLLLAGGMIMCIKTSWELSMLAFTIVGPLILLYRQYARWANNLNRLMWAALSEATSVLKQSIQHVRIVKAMNQQATELEKYRIAAQTELKAGIKNAIGGAGVIAIGSWMDLAVGVLVLWFGGSEVLNAAEQSQAEDVLTIGRLITFQLYWTMINSSYNSLTNVVNSFIKAGSAAQRVFSLLDARPRIETGEGRQLADIDDIEFSEVEFTYQMRPNNKVLRGVSFRIPRGRTFALVGKSGGGKSTIINLLLRYYDPQVGRITVGGVPLVDINPLSYREKIGIVAQDTQLFDASVEENITYGTQNYTQQQLIEAATKANAHEFIQGFDEGYRTNVGESGVRLSGGQRQRLAIARAFLRRPKLLLLDEATSSLDAESEGLVQQAIDTLLAETSATVVLVAHRLSTVVGADTIAVLHDGQIVEMGRHEELLQLNGRYAALVAKQLSRLQNQLPEG